MKIRDLDKELSVFYPASLSCDWDNDGLLVSPDPDAEITGVLVSLEVTDGAIEETEKYGYNLILTHHPLIFHPLSALTPDTGVGRRVTALLSRGISTLAYHTRADAAPGGVNDRMAELLGLSDVSTFADGVPRIGTLKTPKPPVEIAKTIGEITGAKNVLWSGAARTVRRIAICCGDGKDYLAAACDAGADLYLSGELNYHFRLDADDLPMLTCEVGHGRSEMPFLDTLEGRVKEICPAIPTLIRREYRDDRFSPRTLDI